MNPENISKEISDYSRTLLDFNPLFYSFVVLLLVSFVVFILNKDFLIPALRNKEKLRIENLRLIISDNGNGFDFENTESKAAIEKGMGLISMRERAEAIGGHFEIETSPGEGTFLSVEIPIRRKDES
jgi:two-component sensor histidine kinase